MQGRLCLLDFTNQSSSDLFLCPWNDEVQELLVAHHRLVVVSHQIDKESALLLAYGLFERSWLQIAREEDKK